VLLSEPYEPGTNNLRKRDTSLIVVLWRSRLETLLANLERKKANTGFFYEKVFGFFVALNISCYWIAMVTAFPEVAFGPERAHYFMVQFPVGILGAFFDSLSLFVTIYMVRRALSASSSASYVGHLSVDLGIAALATFWVLFVFSVSGWIVGVLGTAPESLLARNTAYQDRLARALQDPTGGEEIRNIYFGVLMGLSAMLPTLTHLYLAIHAAGTVARRSVAPVSSRSN
jgi:hypothetical protein